jgi:hypothetical protein
MQGDAVSRTCVCFWVPFLREDEASELRGVWVGGGVGDIDDPVA